MTFDGAKELFPELSKGPLLGQMLDSGNPGVRLISNDDNIINMLKIVYVENYEQARNFAEALGECDEFLLNPDGKPNREVMQRIEWIKYMLSIFCSVKGRFADAYKQTATGVLTNSMSERGWHLLSAPFGHNNNNNNNDRNNNDRNNNGKRP
jgi:hypothetical protein